MISALAALMLQAAVPVPAPSTSPPPPPPSASPPPPPAPSASPPPPPPPSHRSRRSARARANLASLFSDSDYPLEAMRKQEEGTTGFRLEVGTDGMVTSCSIVSSSGSASLDGTTCRLLTERARFSPAHDRRGRPVTDSVVGRITWRMGEPELPPVERSVMIATVGATPAGEKICSLVINGQPREGDTCPESLSAQMVERARASGRTSQETFVTFITPEGETEAVDSENHGTQLLAVDALVDVAPDGSIRECRVEVSEGAIVSPGTDNPVDPCSAFAPGKKLFQPAPQSAGAARASRKVRVRIRGYFRS